MTIPPNIEKTENSDKLIFPKALIAQKLKANPFKAHKSAIIKVNGVVEKVIPFKIASETAPTIPAVQEKKKEAKSELPACF